MSLDEMALLSFGRRMTIFFSNMLPHRSRSYSILRAKIIQKGLCDKNSQRREHVYSQNLRSKALPSKGKIMSIADTVFLKTGQKIPSIGLGTWQAKAEEVETAVDAALTVGYRHIDTAFNYSNEEAIGRVLRNWLDNGKIRRDELFITTKLPHVGNRACDVPKYLNKSLQRLQLDYIDLYLIHLPFGFVPDSSEEAPATHDDGSIVLDMDTDHVAIWKALEQQVDAGKIKGIGLSNFNECQIVKVVRNARIPPVVLQVELHANFQQKNIRQFCKELGIIVTAYSPIGSPGAKKHFQQKYNYSPSELPDLLGNPLVHDIALKHDKKPAQILLRHLVQHGIVVIPKSANPQRIAENFEISDFTLSDDEMQQLDELDQREKGRIFNFFFWKGVENHPQYPFKKEMAKEDKHINK